MDSDDPRAVQAERRADERRQAHGSIAMRVEAQEIRGQLDNLSQAGALFTGDTALRVILEWEEDGKKRVRTGRLVRALRVDEGELGFAVELD
jgi:hypothetical protein